MRRFFAAFAATFSAAGAGSVAMLVYRATQGSDEAWAWVVPSFMGIAATFVVIRDAAEVDREFGGRA